VLRSDRPNFYGRIGYSYYGRLGFSVTVGKAKILP